MSDGEWRETVPSEAARKEVTAREERYLKDSRYSNLSIKDLYLIEWSEGAERHSQPSQVVEEGGALTSHYEPE